MPRFSWKIDASVLGLSIGPLALGVSALNSNKGPTADVDETRRRLVETALLAFAAAYFTKSYYPIAIPVGYIAFDQAWSSYHGKPPMIGRGIF